MVSFFGAAIYQAWRGGRSNIPGRVGISRLMAALEIAFWGYFNCGLSGGYVMSWFPYLLAGLIGAAGRIAAEPKPSPQGAGFRDWRGRTAESAALPFQRQADQ